MNIPFSELADFILAQDDNTPVDMRQSYFHEKCGCILIQFGKKMFPKEMVNNGGAGYDSLDYGEEDLVKFLGKTSEFIKLCCNKKVKNYKEAKKILLNYI